MDNTAAFPFPLLGTVLRVFDPSSPNARAIFDLGVVTTIILEENGVSFRSENFGHFALFPSRFLSKSRSFERGLLNGVSFRIENFAHLALFSSSFLSHFRGAGCAH